MSYCPDTQLPDKILAAAYGEADTNEEDSEDESSGEEEVQKSRPRKSIYKESSSEGDEQDADDDLDQEKDQDEDFILPSFDESAMGMAGGSFTDADFALTARYIASFNGFSNKTHSSKWVPWSQRYPQRSHKSWAEFYRRNEQSVSSVTLLYLYAHLINLSKALLPLLEKSRTRGQQEDFHRNVKNPKMLLSPTWCRMLTALRKPNANILQMIRNRMTTITDQRQANLSNICVNCLSA